MRVGNTWPANRCAGGGLFSTWRRLAALAVAIAISGCAAPQYRRASASAAGPDFHQEIVDACYTQMMTEPSRALIERLRPYCSGANELELKMARDRFARNVGSNKPETPNRPPPGPMAAKQRAASKAVRDQAWDPWFACVRQATAVMARSEETASVVAEAVLGSCANEQHDIAKFESNNGPLDYKQVNDYVESEMRRRVLADVIAIRELKKLSTHPQQKHVPERRTVPTEENPARPI